MILKNARIYFDGLIHNGAILINNGIISQIKFTTKAKEFKELVEKNQDGKELDCQNKLILPGIIDIHSHLRDMGQKEKETFLTGTMAAAFSGITTIFNMPNTKPPAITENQVKLWIKKAKKHIYIDVGFIAGVPNEIDEAEIERIIDLGVLGFKIYPLSPLNGIDWNKSANIQKILIISSKYQVPIFIHAAFPISDFEREQITEEFKIQKIPILEFHNRLNPVKKEEEFINFIFLSVAAKFFKLLRMELIIRQLEVMGNKLIIFGDKDSIFLLRQIRRCIGYYGRPSPFQGRSCFSHG